MWNYVSNEPDSKQLWFFQFNLFSTPHATPVRDGAVFDRRRRACSDADHKDCDDADADVAVSRGQNVDDFFVSFENWKPIGVHDYLSTAAVTHNKVKLESDLTRQKTTNKLIC